VAEVRRARQAAERAARERAAGTLIGAAGELGVAVAQRAAAAATEAGWSSAALLTPILASDRLIPHWNAADGCETPENVGFSLQGASGAGVG